MSLLEHGVLTKLLDTYYTREGGIPATDAARLIGARSKDERGALAVVLAEFFELRDGVHMQHRCEREIERYRGKSVKARASADARWGAQRSQPERNANALPTQSEGNAPSNQTPDTTTAPKVRRGRGSRLPDDWFLGEDDHNFALTQGMSGKSLQDEASRFADHWRAQPGQKGVKADWPATWRNWVRKAGEFRKPSQTKSFKERDAEFAAAVVNEWTGGRLGRRPAARPHISTEIIDAIPTAPRLD